METPAAEAEGTQDQANVLAPFLLQPDPLLEKETE